MAELADAHGSGPCEGYFMKVRILLSAPKNIKPRSHERGFMFFDMICEDSNLRRRERRAESSGEASGSERSEGDRKGSRGGSLRAERSRRSNPFIRTRRLKIQRKGRLKKVPFFVWKTTTHVANRVGQNQRT